MPRYEHHSRLTSMSGSSAAAADASAVLNTSSDSVVVDDVVRIDALDQVADVCLVGAHDLINMRRKSTSRADDVVERMTEDLVDRGTGAGCRASPL